MVRAPRDARLAHPLIEADAVSNGLLERQIGPGKASQRVRQPFRAPCQFISGKDDGTKRDPSKHGDRGVGRRKGATRWDCGRQSAQEGVHSRYSRRARPQRKRAATNSPEAPRADVAVRKKAQDSGPRRRVRLASLASASRAKMLHMAFTACI